MCDHCGCNHGEHKPEEKQEVKNTEACGCGKNFFELLGKKQAFVFGILMTFLVVCTIGFWIMVMPKLFTRVSKFDKCVDSGKYAARISADQSAGEAIGVQGTPATFINGYMIGGAYPYEAVKDVIDDLLADKTPFIDNFKTIGLEAGELPKVNLPTTFENAVWKGPDTAKVTIVEYSDFECPYCGRFATVMDQVLANYGDKIRFTYRHFPLSFHKSAQKAAEAFECAKDQNKAWDLYSKMFALSNDGKLSLEAIKAAAKEVKLK